MEGKILGITLSSLGALGLMVALFYMSAVETSGGVNFLLGCGVFGAVLFFAGIWLLPAKRASASASATATGKAVAAPPIDKNI